MVDLKLTPMQERTVRDLACLGSDAFGRYIASDSIHQRLLNYHRMDSEAREEIRTDLITWVHLELHAALGAALKGHQVYKEPAGAPPPRPSVNYPAQFTHSPGINWPGTKCGLNTIGLGLYVDICGKGVDCPACLKGEQW